MASKRRHLLRIWLVVAALWMAAGSVGVGQGQYSFRSWQSEDGLPVNLVRSIVQSTDGHMWVATAESVVRFDGLEFERFDLSPGFSYPHTVGIRLFATAGAVVWFASPQGGLLRIQHGKAELVWADDSTTLTPPVTEVVDASDGGVWAMRGDTIWDIRGTAAVRPDPPPPAAVAALREERNRRLDGGRIGVDGVPGRLVDHGGSVWSVSTSGELSVTSPEGFRREISMQRVSPDSQITEILEDREGNIWVATALSGLGMFREDRVEVVNAVVGLSKGAVLAVIQDSGGKTWLGNRRGGVDRIVAGQIEHHDLGNPEDALQVSALYEDRNGRLWAATIDGPVFRWRDSEFVPAFEDDPTVSKINALHHDGRGTMWFGGQSGLMRSSGRRVTQVRAEAGFPGGEEVTAMTGGVANELWLGTSQGFVLRDADGRLETIATPGDLSYSRVSSLLVRAANEVWVTTPGAGLFLWNGERWRHFDRASGLPDSRLTHVVDDKLGHLWFGSSGGIIRASRNDLLANAKNPASPIHWLRMDRSDGLPTRECVGGHHPAGWRFNDGSIWFPTNLGVVKIDPSQTMVNRTPPQIFLRRIDTDGVSHKLPIAGTLRTGPGRTRLEFSYYGLNFSAPEKLNYRTRLVGLEESWRQVGGQRQSTYESVPPGDYRFEVLAMNGDGLLSPAPATVSIRVEPRFWETTWFFIEASLAVVLLAGGIGWLTARNRLKRRIGMLRFRNAREVERARIARDLHDDLGASLTELALLADLGAEQAAGSPFQKGLDELSTKARTLGLTLDEIVWAVNPREDTLASLLDYLASFANEFLDRAGISLRLNIVSGLPDMPLDANLRHSVFLGVREAFNNIVKHSEARSAWLTASVANGMLEVRVEDDGKGIGGQTASRGHGLTNFHVRMQACGGSSEVTPRPGGGTIVRFLVPMLAPRSQHS